MKKKDNWGEFKDERIKLTVSIPSDTHTKLKILAASKGVHMRDIVVSTLEDYMKKNPV